METNSIASNEIEIQPPVALPDQREKRTRKRRIIIFTVVSILNAALLVLLWVLLLTPRSGQSSNSSTDLGDMASPLLGQAAPNFALPTLNGNVKQLQLSNFKGKPVVINFWEASCVPCNDEAPFLQSTWMQQLQAKGVVLVGIDGPESASDALAFLHKYGITYPNVRDTIDGATGISYGTTGNPETFFIDSNGVVRARFIGPLSNASLQTELEKIHVNI